MNSLWLLRGEMFLIQAPEDEESLQWKSREKAFGGGNSRRLCQGDLWLIPDVTAWVSLVVK